MACRRTDPTLADGDEVIAHGTLERRDPDPHVTSPPDTRDAALQKIALLVGHAPDSDD